jgi:hypothetical protein
MLKLMKYEFRKQAFSKVILLVLAGILELVFFAGIIFDNSDILGLGIGLLVAYGIGALFFLSYEAIFTFYNDLKQKSSYMLFLTPHTSYAIVGAKVVSAGIQILLAGVALFLLAALDGSVLVAKFNMLAEVKELVQAFLQQVYNVDLSLSSIIAVTALIITGWVSTLTVAFFAITLSTTFLANSKLNGFVSFIIFIVINSAYSFIINKFVDTTVTIENFIDLTKFFTTQSIFMLVFTVITYLGTAWMLEKKVSV